VAAEGQLDSPDGDGRGGRDIGRRDVLVRMLVDEHDRAAQRGGVGIVTVWCNQQYQPERRQSAISPTSGEAGNPVLAVD